MTLTESKYMCASVSVRVFPQPPYLFCITEAATCSMEQLIFSLQLTALAKRLLFLKKKREEKRWMSVWHNKWDKHMHTHLYSLTQNYASKIEFEWRQMYKIILCQLCPKRNFLTGIREICIFTLFLCYSIVCSYSLTHEHSHAIMHTLKAKGNNVYLDFSAANFV